MATHCSRDCVPYDILNLLADYLYSAPKRKKTKTIGVYEAERVVACKREKEVNIYLIPITLIVKSSYTLDLLLVIQSYIKKMCINI